MVVLRAFICRSEKFCQNYMVYYFDYGDSESFVRISISCPVRALEIKDEPLVSATLQSLFTANFGSLQHNCNYGQKWYSQYKFNEITMYVTIWPVTGEVFGLFAIFSSYPFDFRINYLWSFIFFNLILHRDSWCHGLTADFHQYQQFDWLKL